MRKAKLDSIPKRRKLNRSDIVSLVQKRGGADGLDLTYTDLSNAQLGSSIEPMPPLDGAVFGKYGDVRSGTLAENTLFQRTSLRKTKFTYANLALARFYKSDLQEADLRFVDLTGAIMVEASLVGANLFRTQLIGTNLRGADLRSADIYLAAFSGQTELSKDNFGEYILQENKQEYQAFIERAILPTSLNSIEYHLQDRYLKAAQIYQGLGVHFESNGKHADSVWAYRKERRMRKKWNGQQSITLWKSKQRTESAGMLLNWLGDNIVEALCDYGESVWRVIGWIFILILFVGPLIINFSGGLVWSESSRMAYSNLGGNWQKIIYSYFQHLLYMLDTVTTANFSELRPSNDLVRLESGIMAGIGIFLIGLLGFVAGNRIRH